MSHSPAVSAPQYRAVQTLPSSSVSKESKMYLAILVVAGITLFCHTVVSIATF